MGMAQSGVKYYNMEVKEGDLKLTEKKGATA